MKNKIRLNKLNIFTDSPIQKPENKSRNKYKDLNMNIPSSPNKIIQTTANRGNIIAKSQRNKKIIISNLLNGKIRNKGMNNLYKMYISKDFLEKIESPNKKFALYLPKVFTRKKVKENKDGYDKCSINDKSS